MHLWPYCDVRVTRPMAALWPRRKERPIVQKMAANRTTAATASLQRLLRQLMQLLPLLPLHRGRCNCSHHCTSTTTQTCMQFLEHATSPRAYSPIQDIFRLGFVNARKILLMATRKTDYAKLSQHLLDASLQPLMNLAMHAKMLYHCDFDCTEHWRVRMPM